MKYKTEGELNAGNLSPHPRVQHTHTPPHPSAFHILAIN